MKTNTLKAAAAFGLSALLMGSAAAQESKSRPVGYETITVPDGFSYAGLRLHEAPVVTNSAVVDVPGGATVTVDDGVADLLTAGVTYIFEVTSGDANGAVVLIDSFDTAADTLTLSEESISDDFANGDTFTIRPAATLASVFGADNSAGLDAGNGGPNNADVIYVPNAAGGFDRYYYDEFNATLFSASWSNAADNSPVTAEDVPLIYTDGLVILGGGVANNTFVVSGSVKLTDSKTVLSDGFNYVGTVFPAGATLASTFGPDNEQDLKSGNGGPNNADVIYVPNAGGFDRYYFDEFNAEIFGRSWSNAVDNSAVDATTVSFDDASSIIILHPGADTGPVLLAPDFYAGLDPNAGL